MVWLTVLFAVLLLLARARWRRRRVEPVPPAIPVVEQLPVERAFADYARRLTTWGRWLGKDRLVGVDALHGAYARGRFQDVMTELRLEERGLGVFATYEVDFVRPAACTFEIRNGGFNARAAALSGEREAAALSARQLLRARWGRKFDLTVGGQGHARVRLRRPLRSGADLDARETRDLFVILLQLGEACQGAPVSLVERPVAEIRCPYCRAAADGELVTCTSCRTAHHSDCWAERGGCALLGCDGLGWQERREQAHGA